MSSWPHRKPSTTLALRPQQAEPPQKTEDRPDPCAFPTPLHRFFGVRCETLDGNLWVCGGHFTACLLNCPEHLTDAIDADRQNNKPDPTQKPLNVKQDEPGFARDGVKSDRRQHKAKANGKDRLGDIIAAKAHKGGKGQQHQAKISGGPKRQRHISQKRRKKAKEHCRNCPTHEGGQCGSD